MNLGTMRGNVFWEVGLAVGIIAASVVVAYLVLWIFKSFLTRLTARTKSTLDDHMFQAVRPSVAVFVVVQGVYLALTAVTLLNNYQDKVNQAWAAAVTGLVFWTLQQVISGLIKWYGSEIASRTSSAFDDRALPILNRVVGIVILAIGGLAVLRQFDVEVSPLLAGLGIGGLAVALAVQPTLTNFLSGTYVLSDGSIRTGDFIEVQGGPSGTVEGVGWRVTKIITPLNNLVVIPNSKLADSIVTNFNQPGAAMSLFVTCGVSYESDLERVERVALEVMEEMRQRLPQVNKDYQPLVLFRDFGDSNITFMCVLQAVSRGGSFTVQHELVKSLHRRFTQEGIEINYPVRKLVFADGQKAIADAEAAGLAAQSPQTPHAHMQDDAGNGS